MIDSWADLNIFINDKVMPTASWSGGLLSSAASLLSSSASTDIPSTEISTSTTPAERYGVDEDTAKAIEKLALKYRFAEDLTGANEEAKLCLRKCEDADWGDAADYVACIKSIAQNECTLQQQNPSRAKLKVEAFFANSDIMSGKRGQEYFEQCWRQDLCKESVDFATKTYPDTNHDSVLMDYKKGALRDVFEKVAGLGGGVELR